MVSVLRHVVAMGEGLFKLGVFSKGPPLSYYASRNKRGFGNLMFHLWFMLLGGTFVFLGVSPSILFLVFPFWGALIDLWLARFHQTNSNEKLNNIN
jgi:hypothetical protein